MYTPTYQKAAAERLAENQRDKGKQDGNCNACRVNKGNDLTFQNGRVSLQSYALLIPLITAVSPPEAIHKAENIPAESRLPLFFAVISFIIPITSL